VGGWRAIVIVLLSLASVRAAHACSCSNGVPIQQSSERYRDRAVFTAHVVGLLGRVYNWDGKRLSSQVLAVVKERYWGLPWYWPRVVILDGSYPCDIAMEEAQDYLVSGRRERYGVLNVAVCSRIQLLKTAQIDLRTLDGTHCAAPGGTIIGRVDRGKDILHPNPTAPGVTLTLRDQGGKTYSAQSDRDGIYELQHVAAGIYTVDSRLPGDEYVSGGHITVTDGVCLENSVLIRGYDISGRLSPLPGATVKLVDAESAEAWLHADFEADGRFYFKDIPDGEYLLAVESGLQGWDHDFYYPGTFDRRQATHIRITNHRAQGSNEFDFKPELLPYVPIPVALDTANDAGKFYWRILLTTRGNVLTEQRWTPGIKFVVLYGLRDRSYDIRLWGDANHRRTSQDFCGSKDLPVTAKPDMPLIHVDIPPDCR